jgi:transducin (beta)-like 1
MSLSSDELNVLVYRYLLESGFVHTAFAFSSEAHMNKVLNSVQAQDVTPGSLVAFVQKGLQFDEIEAHVNEVRFYFFKKEEIIWVLGWDGSFV